MAKPQAGITTRPPEHALVFSLTMTTTDPETSRQAIEALRELVHRELRSDLDDTNPGSPKEQPSVETGELGFDDDYERYNLTITVGFAKSAYDKLGIPAEEQPQDLRPIPWEQLADQPEKADNGDIVLQVCSDSEYVNEHALRRIQEELGARFALAWVVTGSQRHNSRAGRPGRREGRALIGFLDGTSNLKPRESEEDAELVFVDPDNVGVYPPQQPTIQPGQPNPYGGPQPPVFPPDLHAPPSSEPAWTERGTYMVVRASVLDTAAWDTRPLGEQERTVGRWKVSGSALDKPDDPSVPPAEPNFAADPAGAVTPLTSHVRKVNPRGPEDEKRRIFRRGYPLILGEVTEMKRGLLFIAFGRTITTQFEFITRAWTVNPDFPQPGTGIDALREFERVLCGGYFFVPPLRNGREPWSWLLPDA